MKALVFSDSHSSYKKIKEAISLQKNPFDAIIFLGDGVADIERIKGEYPNTLFYVVRGNCDFFASDFPDELLICLEGVSVFITHGHKYGAKSGYTRLLYRARELDADAVFFGHTHCPLDSAVEIQEKSIRLFNPGSVGSGSFGVVNISGNVMVTSHGKLL